MLEDAERTVGRFLAPLTVEDFLGRMLLGGVRKIEAGDAAARTELLGPDPTALLGAAIQLAPTKSSTCVPAMCCTCPEELVTRLTPTPSRCISH